MVKNEESTIIRTLDSTLGIADSIKIYDTGSTDNTLDLIEKWSENKKVDIRKGVFVDFETSRNKLLDFVDEDENVDVILLLDSNDEIVDNAELKEIIDTWDIESMRKETSGGFFMKQVWKSGSLEEYFNIRCVLPRMGWRYTGAVHEYISRTSFPEGTSSYTNAVHLPLETCHIFQDRMRGAESSQDRYKRDKQLLLKQIDDKETSRALFYLAQTCACMNEFDEALKYYIKRSILEDFPEERYISLVRAADAARKIGKPFNEIVNLYLQSLDLFNRAEPLCALARLYHEEGPHKNYFLAYAMTAAAIQLPYPKDCILFVDKNVYDYTRYHLHGISAFYVGDMKGGKEACLMAIVSGQNSVDKENLKHYI